jgi:hypothetical protein
MPTVSVRSTSSLDETRTFPKGKLDVVTLSGVMFDRQILGTGLEMVSM